MLEHLLNTKRKFSLWI